MIFTQWWLEFQYQISCTQAKGDSYSGQLQQLQVSFQLRAAVYLSDLSNKPQPSEAHEPDITWSDGKRIVRISSADRRPSTRAPSLLNLQETVISQQLKWGTGLYLTSTHLFHLIMLNHTLQLHQRGMKKYTKSIDQQDLLSCKCCINK